MEFFKEWTGGIAAAIIFASLCEIMLPSGNMKKYVKLMLGIILSVSMLKPLADNGFNKWSEKLFEFERSFAYTEHEEMDEDEKQAVIALYTEKLEQAVKNKLSDKVNADLKIVIKVETENKEKFGQIKEVSVTVLQNDGFKDYRDIIYDILKTDFGVSEENISIRFKTG